MKRFRCNHFFVAISIVLMMLSPGIAPASAASATTRSPQKTQQKIANIFLSWRLTRAEASTLAAWDLVILDAEIGRRQNDLIRLMRIRNPHIKILAYISANEIHTLNDQLTHEAPLRGKLHARLSDHIFLKRASGTRAVFWPSATLLNMNSDWKTILPEFIHEEVLSAGVWDGVLLDNLWNGITWYVGEDIDLDSNGIADDPTQANAVWKESTHHMLARLRALQPHALIVANTGAHFPELDGILIENVLSRDWDETQKTVAEFRIARAEKPAPLIIMNTVNGDAKKQSRERFLNGLEKARVTDAYYSFDAGETSHAQLWWFPEYGRRRASNLPMKPRTAPR